MADVHALMRPTPTGASLRGVDELRPEFQLYEPQTIDAPEFIPTSGCFNWTCPTGKTIYTQPCGLVRSHLWEAS